MLTHRPAAAPRSRRNWPLGWRLPLSISVIIVAALSVFLWLAYARVETTLLTAGSERARSAASQIGSLFERSTTLTRDEIHRLAANPAVRRALEQPDAASQDAAREALSTGAAATARRIELWSADGRRILAIARPRDGIATSQTLPEATWPLTPGTAPLRVAGDMVYFDHVEEVSAATSSTRLGYLVIRGTLSVSPPGILARLVGNDARILVGSNGGAWTDIASVVPAPPLSLVHDGIADYPLADHGRRLAAVTAVQETPWLVWVDFPRDTMVAPAASFLRQMTLVALLIVGAAAVLVRLVTRRLTTPLSKMTGAAEAMVAGDYSHRVPAEQRGDEVSRLAHAFNQMAANVETSYQWLEARISERTATLQALRTSEARYRAIIDVGLDAIITIDRQGVVVEFNPAAEQIFGYRRDAAVGQPLATLIVPPAWRDAHLRGFAHYLETGEGKIIRRMVELTAMRADGTEFPMELAITAIDAPGSERFFTGVLRDITQRKRAEAALRESERAFRATFDEAPLGMAQVSVDGRWLRVNRRVTTLFGYEPDDILGERFAHTFDTGDLPPGIDPWRAILDNGVPNAAQERRGRRKDGATVWVNLTVSAHVDDAGAPLYYIVVMEDTAERRRFEERLRQSQKMEAIGRLAGGVAHDFNNLLTAILGYANLLADEFEAGDRRRRDVDEIIRAAERSASLTRQLLAFSRKQVLQPTTVDLNRLVRDTADMLRRVIGEHIDLATSLAPEVRAVLADPTQLEQIVMNLAVNARDAMPAGGRLTIETANVELDDAPMRHPAKVRPGPYVLLAVHDTGFGMDDDTKSRLFEPFFTTKEQGRGTGLGLATVYGIVKQSGGYIWVDSEPDEGATFKVYLPVADVQTPGSARALPAALTANGTETILLVEDERAVRILARVMLERAGYQVLDCGTPEDACTVFEAKAESIDLLITDIVMPGSHGPALYQQLARQRPGLKVLFMSGYTDAEIVRAGPIELGVNFIEKPFSAGGLTQKVREVLDR